MNFYQSAFCTQRSNLTWDQSRQRLFFASADGFEECREEMRQILKAKNIPSVLLMYVISNVPKRAAATTDSITIPIKLWY